ncbi:MAG TPA: hypothetical protein VHE35_11705, partial [Kofleriaceae bacterium]|nr:hypothetical protein [Kofleriaceae bacterium]
MAGARRRLRARFVTAAALLVITGTVASGWTLVALSRLGDALGAIVRGNDRVSAATARLSGALEREDDALLLLIAADPRGHDALVRERAATDEALAAVAGAV